MSRQSNAVVGGFFSNSQSPFAASGLTAVASDGSPGDVETKHLSKSDSELRKVEFIGKDFDNPYDGGVHPWTVENGTTSTLLLYNQSNSPQWFNVQISAGKTVWSKSYQLQPQQTEAVVINDLIKSGAKDNHGVAFPSDIWSGQAGWSVPQKNAGQGRLMQSNRDRAMARNFSCSNTVQVCQAQIDNADSFFLLGQTIDFGQIEFQVCYQSCSGTPVGNGEEGYSYSWDTENSSVASISGSWQNQSVDLYGAGIGGTMIDAYVSDFYCSIQAVPSQPATVTPSVNSISPSQGLVGTGIGVTITGSGFDSSTTISAGTNITVSNVSVVSITKITATFTPSNSKSAGGNQGITVIASGQTSNSKNFYVQVPTHLGRITEPATQPNGIGPLHSGTNITVYAFNGTTVMASNVCGGYEWLTYALADQQGNQITNGTVTFAEAFNSVSPSPDPLNNPVVGPPASPNLASQVLTDIYAVYISAPSCPPASVGDSFNQTWTATVGAMVYNLTTVIKITRTTNSSGLPTFTSTITTD